MNAPNMTVVDEDDTLDHFCTPQTFAYQAIVAAGFTDWAARKDVLMRAATMLEPSAGEGHIARAMRQAAAGIDLDVIEMDITRWRLLREQGFIVVAQDFLEYQTAKRYERIAMCPPRNKATKHVVHAWGMLAEGGTLVAFIPTTLYPDVNNVNLHKLIDVYGTRKHMPRGFVFPLGDDCDMDMIVVKKPGLAGEAPGWIVYDTTEKKDGDVATVSRSASSPSSVDGAAFHASGKKRGQRAKIVAPKPLGGKQIPAPEVIVHADPVPESAPPVSGPEHRVDGNVATPDLPTGQGLLSTDERVSPGILDALRGSDVAYSNLTQKIVCLLGKVDTDRVYLDVGQLNRLMDILTFTSSEKKAKGTRYSLSWNSPSRLVSEIGVEIKAILASGMMPSPDVRTKLVQSAAIHRHDSSLTRAVDYLEKGQEGRAYAIWLDIRQAWGGGTHWSATASTDAKKGAAYFKLARAFAVREPRCEYLGYGQVPKGPWTVVMRYASGIPAADFLQKPRTFDTHTEAAAYGQLAEQKFGVNWHLIPKGGKLAFGSAPEEQLTKEALRLYLTLTFWYYEQPQGREHGERTKKAQRLRGMARERYERRAGVAIIHDAH